MLPTATKKHDSDLLAGSVAVQSDQEIFTGGDEASGDSYDDVAGTMRPPEPRRLKASFAVNQEPPSSKG